MFEIFKPAPQTLIQRADDPIQALPVIALGHASDVVFEFLQALPARPLLALLEMVSEKIKASWLHRIYHSCFVWMQLQSCLRSPFFQQFQGLPGFSFALTHYHQSSSAGESHPHALTEPYVNFAAHTAPTIQHQV
jgi:hypothetical protein